jgi:alkylhydroperoxidase family enzyme
MPTRIPYPDLATKTAKVQEIVGQAPINVSRMMANASPGVVEGFIAMGKSFYQGTDLPADLREIGILRAGYVAKSDYETWQHESIARSVGLSDAAIAAVKAGKAAAGVLNPAQEAVLAFTDELVVNGTPSDAALAAAQKHLPVDQLLDLVLVTGYYMMISRFLNTTGVERDTDRGPIDARFISKATS